MGEAVEHGGPHLQLHHLSLEGARHHPLGDPLALSAFVYGAQFFVTYFCLVGLLIPSAYLTARPLAGIVRHVTLIEFDSKLRADAVLQRKLFSLPNVTVIVSALSTEVHGDGQKVNGLSYQDRTNATLHRVELEGIFVQIGLLPNSEWLKGTVELTPRGEVVIDGRRLDRRPQCVRPPDPYQRTSASA